ncbi:30S ribosomal protein S21 [Patescibacteria group bacterium]|nr:30S ribosomal protein S21 [Patescibacteria group bacterium]
MVEVKKKDGESTESLIRRFTKKVQSSGVLIRAKKGRFYAPKKTQRESREDAARRTLIRDKKEYLRKIGKLEEYIDPKRPNKRGTIKKLLQAKVRMK